MEKLIPDTSVIIEGLVSQKLNKGEIKPETIIIHEAVVAELEHQANQNKAMGFLGIEELQKIKELTGKLGFKLEFAGKKPSAAEIKYASLGEIDAMIRDLAYEADGTLFTADKIQARIAETKSIKTIYVKVEQLIKKLRLESYFDETTMSAHLRENVLPFAKKGMPGNWQFMAIGEKLLTRDDIQDISREIIEEAGIRKDSFIEIERPGSTIVQLGLFRIVVTKPPFSDGWEITAVKPVKKLNLDDYKMSDKLKQRVAEQAEGILIAGAPGMGKSTFAMALAEYYASQNKIIKTVEAPRDLILPDNITQYAISHGDAQEIHDILLLSRPDYTIFDEMRNTGDFQLFADLRLAGVGMAGVVHATNPIDAIQRFVGRIELGVIPQIIDTVIFIKNGFINKVLSLQMVVKVPSGMTEADLSRPVVVVTDFETKKLEYELYSYGEETVVVPVRVQARSATHELAARTIMQELRKYADDVEVDIVSEGKCIVRVPENNIARIIGKEGKTISEIEKRLGISIDVQELGAKKETSNAAENAEKRQLQYDVRIKKNMVVFYLDIRMQNNDVDVYVGDDFLLTAKVGKTGIIKIKKDNKIGQIIINAINGGEKVKLVS
ncbi:Flp pilus assembly complex ATPase component TadA [Candidatus Woesearchaeota archaeon]|nr:Flp pilus assembly complex ATPase component TadA [Candidatus Woesearchaeota archaeon]